VLPPRILRPGHWFGELPLAAHSTQAHDARTDGFTRVGEIDHHHIKTIMTKHAEFASSLFDWQSMRLASVVVLLEEHANLGVAGRVARQLYRVERITASLMATGKCGSRLS
jgi:CRP-like cAMP-binding protein